LCQRPEVQSSGQVLAQQTVRRSYVCQATTLVSWSRAAASIFR
jgi:hypothetical protein